MVERSQNITLAKVLSVSKENPHGLNTFTFSTLKILRGNVPESFSLQGYSAGEVKDHPGTFSHHQDPGFWTGTTGNTLLPGDCNAYGIFAIGKTYLIFYDMPSHVHSYEEVASGEDQWLVRVNKLIAETVGKEANGRP